MLCVLVVFAVAVQSGAPGPLDAFLANRHAIECEVKFTLTTYNVDTNFLKTMRGFAHVPLPGVQPLQSVEGRWGASGDVEHYVLRNTSPRVGSHDGQKNRIPYMPSDIEVLRDPQMIAYHDISDGQPPVYLRISQKSPVRLIGPFAWSGGDSFPAWLYQDIPAVTPLRHEGALDGRRVTVETYTRVYPDALGTYKVEVCYDPSLAYTPIYVRGFTVDKAGTGYVKETAIVEATPSATGGIVPTEWFSASYQVNAFDKRYPVPDETTVFEASGRVYISHFKGVITTDPVQKVGLDQLVAMQNLHGPGGVVVLKRGASPTTMQELKRLLAGKMDIPSRPLPNIDASGLQDTPHASGFPLWTACVLVVFAVAAIYFVGRRISRRAWTFGVAATLLGACGCGARPNDSVPQISIAYEPSVVVYPSTLHTVPLTLVCTNEGRQPITLYEVDGGCTCRRVDKASFPKMLRPGERLIVRVNAQTNGSFQPEGTTYRLTTDVGVIERTAVFHAMAKNTVDPADVVVSALTPQSVSSFEIIHRQIAPLVGGFAHCKPIAPNGLSVGTISTATGVVRNAESYKFLDTTYRITISDMAIGLHKEILTFVDEEEKPMGSCSVVWERVAYLSSIPSRAVVDKRPVRVFLRCPQETVELTKVLSTPEGIKAVVSSPREVTVMVTEESPRGDRWRHRSGNHRREPAAFAHSRRAIFTRR